MVRKFYDIHYHLFDLSHPNLLAFLLNDDLLTEDSLKKLLSKFPFILKMLPLWVLKLFPQKAIRKVKDYIRNDAGNLKNLLSVMEGAIEYHFLYVEYFLKREKNYFGDHKDALYNKIALCPLLIDFGYKNLANEDCFYNLPPAKPVINQVVDLINAMWFYYNYDLILHPDKQSRLKIIPTDTPKEKKLFEIYPFLGLNTVNYDLQEIAGLFDKYFRGYEDDDPVLRRQKLIAKMGTVRADIEDMIFRRKEKKDPYYYTYLFTGIKLYPPIGFDPWPEDKLSELEKVKFVYSECVRKKLPITVHCSDSGFIASPEAKSLTDPSGKWNKVLSRQEFRDLKINFAHIGAQAGGRKEWQEVILKYIGQGRNVYTDCSCQTPYVSDYDKVNNIMNSANESGFLFGSDFVINLIWSHSYNEYLNNFVRTPLLDERKKELMAVTNPERFLFGS